MELSKINAKDDVKIGKRTLGEMICDKVIMWIMEGTLEPGQRIREEDLAEAFGVSRVPIREALRMLENRGLIQIEPYVGANVVKLSPDDIKEIYYLRSELESLACKKAAQNMTDDDINELIELQEILETIWNAETNHLFSSQIAYEYNRKFHMFIYQKSNMNILMEVINNLWDRIAFLRIRTAYHQSYPTQMQNEHREYIRLLKEQRGDDLAELLKENLSKHLNELIAVEE